MPKVPAAYFTNGELQQGEDVRLPIPAFFDEFVLVVTAATPEELIPKCARVLEKTGKVVASRGMEVNDSVGKTEVLLQFNETGAAKVREAIEQEPRRLAPDTPSSVALTSGSPNNTNIWFP